MSSRLRIDLAAVFVFVALGAMFAAVPRYVVEQLGGDRATAGFAVSVFFVAAIVTRPLAGRFIDRHGRRPLLVTLPFVLAGAIGALALATTVPAVLLLRFVQGMAGGAFYVVAVTAETDLVPPERRASAIARLSIAIYTGFAAGPALGEWLIDFGAAQAWLVLAAFAATGGILAVTVGETRKVERDGPAEDRPAEHADEPELTGISDVAAATAVERVPLLHPAAVLPGLTLLCLGVGYTSITGLSALYSRSIGMGSSEVLFATFAGSILLLRLGSGRLADRVGPTRVMVPGMGCYVIGFTLLATIGTPTAAIIGVAFVGAGWAVVFPAATSWVASQVPDRQRGAALGTLVSFMDIGQGSGGYIVGAVADRAGFGWGFAVPAALAVLATVILVTAIRRAAVLPVGAQGQPGTTDQ